MDYKDLIIPQINVNDDKVTIEDIRFNNLDFVNIGEIIYTVSTSKSITDYETDFKGYIIFFVSNGDEVKIGESAGIIYTNKSDAENKLLELQVVKSQVPSNISKKALDYAFAINFDLSKLKKEGIIKVQDIDEYLKNN